MRPLRFWMMGIFASMLLAAGVALAAELAVSATAVSLSVGAKAAVQVTGASGRVRITSLQPSIATASLSGSTITITGVAAGETKVNVSDSYHTVTVAVKVTGTTTTPPPSTGGSSAPWRVLASNDLGMHCADLDYQIFSILPPFNVVHAQVLLPGTATTKPR